MNQKPRMIAFFNNKGGVGKTSLVYHLAWMYSDLGQNVIAADLDPQANLTSMFLEESQLETIWSDAEPKSILGSLRPIIRGIGDINPAHLEAVSDSIHLLPGDLGLSRFEDKLSTNWPLCLDGQEAAFRTTSAFYRLLLQAARTQEANLVLIDVGPNLGAINRAALICADYVVVPLAPDLYSLQGLRNLGPTLRDWRTQWKDRLERNPDPDLELPAGSMQPGGYVVLQHAMRLDRPVKAYNRWMQRIPGVYEKEILNEEPVAIFETDPHRLGLVKHYQSLMPMAMDAHKPMFELKPADGAIGAHTVNVKDAYKTFKQLAENIATACDFTVPISVV
jgi:chromosome partitioning protein